MESPFDTEAVREGKSIEQNSRCPFTISFPIDHECTGLAMTCIIPEMCGTTVREMLVIAISTANSSTETPGKSLCHSCAR